MHLRKHQSGLALAAAAREHVQKNKHELDIQVLKVEFDEAKAEVVAAILNIDSSHDLVEEASSHALSILNRIPEKGSNLFRSSPRENCRKDYAAAIKDAFLRMYDDRLQRTRLLCTKWLQGEAAALAVPEADLSHLKETAFKDILDVECLLRENAAFRHAEGLLVYVTAAFRPDDSAAHVAVGDEADLAQRLGAINWGRYSDVKMACEIWSAGAGTTHPYFCQRAQDSGLSVYYDALGQKMKEFESTKLADLVQSLSALESTANLSWPVVRETWVCMSRVCTIHILHDIVQAATSLSPMGALVVTRGPRLMSLGTPTYSPSHPAQELGSAVEGFGKEHVYSESFRQLTDMLNRAMHIHEKAHNAGMGGVGLGKLEKNTVTHVQFLRKHIQWLQHELKSYDVTDSDAQPPPSCLKEVGFSKSALEKFIRLGTELIDGCANQNQKVHLADVKRLVKSEAIIKKAPDIQGAEQKFLSFMVINGAKLNSLAKDCTKNADKVRQVAQAAETPIEQIDPDGTLDAAAVIEETVTNVIALNTLIVLVSRYRTYDYHVHIVILS